MLDSNSATTYHAFLNSKTSYTFSRNLTYKSKISGTYLMFTFNQHVNYIEVIEVKSIFIYKSMYFNKLQATHNSQCLVGTVIDGIPISIHNPWIDILHPQRIALLVILRSVKLKAGQQYTTSVYNYTCYLQ